MVTVFRWISKIVTIVNQSARLLIIASMLVLCSNSPEAKSNGWNGTLLPHLTEKVPLEPTDKEGESLYIKYCLSCHQKDGSGVPNMFPPIQKSDWVNGDKSKLINVLLKGLKGDIDVNGEQYSQVMPKQDYLTDVQISQILTYIRQNFGNNADAVTPDEVTNLRNKK
jgi:mono/diheme cytochrome c family protein